MSPSAKSFIGGSIAGFSILNMSCTFDLLKIRAQTKRDSRMSYKQELREILAKEGYYGLTRGYMIQLIRDVPGYGTYFVVYENLRRKQKEAKGQEHGFINLDVNALIRDENERKTEIGQEMHAMVQNNKIIPAEMMVRMLKKIIYSGSTEQTKFILTSFPDIIEQAKEFELNCSRISAIIYSTTEDSIVEIKNNNLSLFNIDSLF